MIAYVKGRIEAKSPSYLILVADSVGYKINTGSSPKGEVGEEAEYYCFHYIREDINELYGFEKYELLELFELLLTVSGVGPKVAQAILTQIGREKVISAIINNDVNLFKSVSGVGTKVAAKIIVELKSKMSKDEIDLESFEQDETVDALLSLGLKKSEILPALKSIPAEMKDTQSKVKYVLKHASRKN